MGDIVRVSETCDVDENDRQELLGLSDEEVEDQGLTEVVQQHHNNQQLEQAAQEEQAEQMSNES